MEWVHCNSCFLTPKEGRNKQFSLTSCGHIFCQICIQKPGFINKCVVCGNSTFTTTPLNSDLRSDIREYFKSPDDIFKQGLQVSMFQSGHRSRITTYYKSLSSKYRSSKQEVIRLNELLQKKDKECKKYNELLQKKDKECKKYSELLQKRDKEYKELKQLFKQKVHKTDEKQITASIKNNTPCESQEGSSTFLHTPKQNNLTCGSSVSLNMPRSGITLSQSSMYSMPRSTPKRLTLSKLSLSHSNNATSSMSSRGSIMSTLSSPFSQNTFNCSPQYRMNSQYPSQSNSPSTPGTLPRTPESTNESPIGRNHLESPISKFKPPYSSSNNSGRLFNNLNLAFKQARKEM